MGSRPVSGSPPCNVHSPAALDCRYKFDNSSAPRPIGAWPIGPRSLSPVKWLVRTCAGSVKCVVCQSSESFGHTWQLQALGVWGRPVVVAFQVLAIFTFCMQCCWGFLCQTWSRFMKEVDRKFSKIQIRRSFMYDEHNSNVSSGYAWFFCVSCVLYFIPPLLFLLLCQTCSTCRSKCLFCTFPSNIYSKDTCAWKHILLTETMYI